MGMKSRSSIITSVKHLAPSKSNLYLNGNELSQEGSSSGKYDEEESEDELDEIFVDPEEELITIGDEILSTSPEPQEEESANEIASNERNGVSERNALSRSMEVERTQIQTPTGSVQKIPISSFGDSSVQKMPLLSFGSAPVQKLPLSSFGGGDSSVQKMPLSSFGGEQKLSARGNSSPNFGEAWSKKDELCGYLFKQAKLGWKTRWFCYNEKNHRLLYFEKKEDKEPINFISLDAKTIISPALHDVVPDKKYAGFSFVITTSYTYKEYVLCSHDKKDYARWIISLREAVSRISDENEEEVKYIDRVFDSYTTAKENKKLNFPVTDVILVSAEISKRGDYFGACYATNHKFRTYAIEESNFPVWNCDGTL